MTFERAKTRLERGLPATPPKKPKKAKARHDGYDPGYMTDSSTLHRDGDPCPIEGCGLPIYEHCSKNNIQACPLGRGCDDIPRRYV